MSSSGTTASCPAAATSCAPYTRSCYRVGSPDSCARWNLHQTCDSDFHLMASSWPVWGRRWREQVLPLSSGPTQVGTTPNLAFRALLSGVPGRSARGALGASSLERIDVLVHDQATFSAMDRCS